MTPRDPIRLSIVIAARNEGKHIGPLLDSVLAQDWAGLPWEAIVADGMSDDGTRETVLDYCDCEPRIRYLPNPERIASTGLNAAIRFAQGNVILRMDAHTEYARDYCRRCVETLLATGAANCGGPARTNATSFRNRAIAAAYHSRFSTGGAHFHDPAFEGWVDTVPYGCWWKETLERVGLFDESLVRNQDDELNFRLIRAGGRIWQSPSIVSWYTPRETLSALFRQYFQYGYWKIAVLRKHRLPASVRQLVPAAAIVLALLLAMAAAAGEVWCGKLVLAAGGAYIVLTLVVSAQVAAEKGWRLFWLLPAVFATYHLSYGTGFLAGLCLSLRGSRQPVSNAALFTRLSR